MRVAGTLAEIYPVLLEQVAELLKAQGTAIALLDTSTGEMIIVLGYGAWEDWTGLHMDPEKSISGLVISSGKPCLTNDVQHDPHVANPDLFKGIANTVCVPLNTNRNRIGALWMGCRTPITEDDMRLLSAIGDMAANAIQRQVLFEDLQTQLKAVNQAQARLVQSEKLAAIGQLVSGVAHELNNPLTSVILYSQLLEKDIHDETVRNNVSKIVSEAIRAGRIVRGLLNFARQQPIKQELVQVNDILRSTLDLLAYELNAQNIKFELELLPELPKIMADPHQLTQVFVNLIQNAWQAMSSAHGNGHLKIETEIGESIYLLSGINHKKMVRILIKDDGPGISDEVMTSNL